MNWNSKEDVLREVKRNPSNFEYASDDLKNDKDICLAAIRHDGIIYQRAIKYIGEEIKNDRDFVLEVCKLDGWFIRYANERFLKDREVVLEACKNNGMVLYYADNKFKSDYEIVMTACKNNKGSLYYASDELKDNFDVCMEAVNLDGFALEFVSDRLKNNKEIILQACKKDSRVLHYVNENILESDFGKDLKKAIENNSLATFKEDYSYYFKPILDSLKDNSNSFNEVLKIITKEDLKNPDIMNALCDRFSQYEISNDFNIERLRNNSNHFIDYLKTIDFNYENFKEDIFIEKK